MFDLLKDYLKDFHSKDEILLYLFNKGYRIDERQFRRECKKIKEEFINGVRDYTIASNPKDGYIITKDPSLINRSKKDYIARGVDCLRMARGIEKQLGYQHMIYLPIADRSVSLSELILAFEEEEQ